MKEVIKGRKITQIDRARDFKDDTGVLFWKLLKNKDKIPAPPPEAIETTSKGKKIVHVYKTETGEYVYGEDIADIRDPPPEIKKDPKLLELWRKDNKIITAYQPLTTQQRIVWVNQIRKAEERKGKGLQEHIPMIAGILSVTIIVIALMVFYADMGEPLLKMAREQNKNQELRNEEMQIFKEIKLDIQRIKSELDVKDEKPPD